MADHTLEEGSIPVGDTGKLLATVTVTNEAGQTVHREEIVITDPINLDARLRVLKDYFSGEYVQPSINPQHQLYEATQLKILAQLKKQTEIMAYTSEYEDS